MSGPISIHECHKRKAGGRWSRWAIVKLYPKGNKSNRQGAHGWDYGIQQIMPDGRQYGRGCDPNVSSSRRRIKLLKRAERQGMWS